MNLSFIDKLGLILNYFISSFLGIEMFLVILILFIFLMLNLKKNNIIIKICVPCFIICILLFISGGFHGYVVSCIDGFIKKLMNYYYFPSIMLYYILILVVTFLFIYTIINDNINKIKKIINYIFFSFIYLCFLGLFSYIISNGIVLTLDYSLYRDEFILSFIQVSNLVLFIWVLITLFIYFYKYLKKRFDH